MGCLALLFGLLVAPALASAARVHPRIVAGEPTKIEAVPFQVALYAPQVLSPEDEAAGELFGAQFCGGVILDATHVITAAHCISGALPEEIEVLAGAEDLESANAGPEHVEDPVVRTSFDPNWDPLTSSHDIGLLTLRDPLWTPASEPRELNGLTPIAPIPLASEVPPAETPLTVSGWGYTEPLTEIQQPTNEEGFSPVLQSTVVPLVDHETCVNAYASRGVTIEPDMICAGGGAPDACYGDSGGPLVINGAKQPEDYELLGIVDFGLGCGQEGTPGVYQSVVDPENRDFVKSNPPQAPLNQGVPSITGTAQPGQAVACAPGSWLGSPEFRYSFFRDESTILHPFAEKALTPEFSSGATYGVQSGDAGTRIFCRVIARNSGGYGEATADDVSVSAAPLAPVPIAASSTSTSKSTPKQILPLIPPTLRVVSSRCRRASCAVNVHASKGAGGALVTAVEARLTFTRKISCRKHGKRASCRRTFKRKLAARATPGGHFLILATGLRPGNYTLTLVAIDRAGIHQTHPTRLGLLLKAPRKRH